MTPGQAAHFVEAVAAMRRLQVEFFNPRTRRPDTVRLAKAAEKRVDAMLAEEMDDAPSLFGKE